MMAQAGAVGIYPCAAVAQHMQAAPAEPWPTMCFYAVAA